MYNVNFQFVSELMKWIRSFCHNILVDNQLAMPAFLTLFGFCVMGQFSELINHDTGWYLYSAEAFIKGGHLYKDVFWEVNPPITLYLTIPPVWLGMNFGGSIPHWFLSYVFTLIIGSLLLVNHTLHSLRNLSIAEKRIILLLAFFCLAILPGGAIGQREHLAMILIMPYVFLSALRASGSTIPFPIQGVVGVLGGIGFVLKPYFLVGPVFLEIFLIFQRRTLTGIFRGETLGLTLSAGFCGLAVFIFTPEYVNTVVPFALKVYNSAYRNSLLYVVSRLESILFFLILVLHFLTRKKERFPTLSSTLLVLALGFYCVYLFQMKGWSYHIYPVTALLLMSLTVMVLGISDSPFQLIPPHSTPIISKKLYIVMIGVVSLMIFLPFLRGGYTNSVVYKLIPIVEKHASGQWIYSLSANVWTGFPLVNYTTVEWSSRFPALWLLPGLIQARQGKTPSTLTNDSSTLDEIEHFSMEAILSDLTSKPPSLVIVDVRPKKTHFGGVEFDYIEYLSANPKFKTLWSKYELIADLGGFQVFKQNCPTPCGEFNSNRI